MATKVMKADATAADAWAEIDLGSDQPDVWVTFRLYFTAEAATFWIANLSGSFVALYLDPGHQADGVLVNSGEYQTSFSSLGGPPVGGDWILVEHHHVDGGASDLYLDSALVASGTDGNGYDTRIVRVGQDFATPDASGIAYFDDIKIGTTRGGDDLFADDFESGTLAAWDTSGSVSVVDDPIAPPGPPECIVSAFTGVVARPFTEGDERTRLAATGSAARRKIPLHDQNVQTVTIRLQPSEPASSFQVFGIEVDTLPHEPKETGGQ